MAFQTQFNFPVKKSLQRSTKKLGSTSKENVSVKRALFDSPSQSKKHRQDENSNMESTCSQSSNNKNVSLLFEGKQVFHTGQPSRLIGRTQEISEIENFLGEHITKRKGGCLYISGAPGTGKTSSLLSVIEKWKSEFSYAFINCMSVSNPSDIYKSIAQGLKLPSKTVNSKNVAKALEKHMVTSTSMNVLILDEIDLLDCKGQDVLYTLFEWPQLPKSSLILIGIANALDLTDRILPRLHVFKSEPKLMHFHPYSKDQIIQILEDRLSSIQNRSLIQPVALQLCARKIAACTGDIRKALNVCHRAIQVASNKRKNGPVLQSTSDDRFNPGSPSKRSPELYVDISDINAVLQEVFGSRLLASTSTQTVTMPIQQMVLLCTIILVKKFGKTEDMVLGKTYDIYKRICNKRNIVAVSELEFNGLSKMLETRGVILLKPAKFVRMTKIVLQIDESEAEYLLQDKALLPSILADKSVLERDFSELVFKLPVV